MSEDYWPFESEQAKQDWAKRKAQDLADAIDAQIFAEVYAGRLIGKETSDAGPDS